MKLKRLLKDRPISFRLINNSFDQVLNELLQFCHKFALNIRNNWIEKEETVLKQLELTKYLIKKK